MKRLPTGWFRDDVIKWKHFPRYWPFVRGIHRSPVNSPHKGQWHGALIFSLICAWINAWVNNREASDLRRHRVHYDVILMRIHEMHVLHLCLTTCNTWPPAKHLKHHWLSFCRTPTLSFVWENTNQGIWKFVKFWQVHNIFNQIEYVVFLIGVFAVVLSTTADARDSVVNSWSPTT